MTVADHCTREVVTASRDETLVSAARRMREAHVGDVVVVNEKRQPVGMLTDRDIVVSAVAQSPENVPALLVGDVMSADVVTVRAADPLETAVRTMQNHGIRRLPVVGAEGRLEGILTLDDLLRRVSIDIGKLVALVAMEQRHEREVRAH